MDAALTRQKDELKWVYYQNVDELVRETGMSTHSAAYESSVWYKFWMAVLGDDTYNGDNPATGAERTGHGDVRAAA